VVLDLLCGGDEGDVADGLIGSILDAVFGFGDQRGDDLAGLGLVLAIGLQDALDFGDVAAGLFEVVRERLLELRVGGLFDHGGESLGDVLFYVEGLLQVVEVKFAEVLEIGGKEFHVMLL
jgi:hypothetical protein